MAVFSVPRLAVVFCLCLAAVSPARAADKWLHVATSHFDVVGNTTDSDLRRIGQTLEHFHDVVVDAVLHSTAQSGRRATVLVFQDDLSFTPYKPQGAGRSQLGGVFYLSGTRPILALNAEDLGWAFRSVMNGYSQSIAITLSGDVPLWLTTGLGQVYETFEERGGGKGAMIGRPDQDTVAFLRGATLLPLATITSATRESPNMTLGTAPRALYNAESWALVHYLSFGPRRDQFNRYMAALHSGVASDQAFAEAFGDLEVLEREVRDYVRKFTFPVLQVAFDEKVRPAMPAKGQVLNEADAEGFLSVLLLHSGYAGQARTRLEKALAANPKSARANAALGDVEIADRHLEVAVSLYEKAAALAPDDQRVQATLGHYLSVRVAARRTAVSADEVSRARAALGRAVQLEPNDVVATAELGWMWMYGLEDLDQAVDLLGKAVRLNRGEDQYRLWLAEAYVRQNKYDEARRLLGPLMARGSTPDIRTEARRLMVEMANRPTPGPAPAR